MTRLLSLLMSLLVHPLCSFSKSIPAVCVVPVADLLSEKVASTNPSLIKHKYASLPLSEKQPLKFCCRATQLLFNDQVTIIEQKGEQSFVETSFWHTKTPSLGSPSSRNNRFWTLTTNLQPISTLSPEAQATIPPSPPLKSTQRLVTLWLPWYCPETHTTYSAGTQFMVKEENNDHYSIALYTSHNAQVVESTVPKTVCVLYKTRTHEEKRTLFLQLIRQWAQGIPHKIPYVLGGGSIVATFENPFFEEKKIKVKEKTHTVFTGREGSSIPHTGVDCSGLIRLACKIAEIPLTATNSKSIAHSLPHLTSHQTIQDGDILFWKGHTAIVSNAKKGLLIESRGYEHNYGVLHEIPYNVELQGITTTAKLKEAYLKKKPIQRLDKEGHPREIIADLTILSLMPVKAHPWET
jgi:hypothetical protein